MNFQRKMSVLVNGSSTKEFVMEKGMKQGDPLSPFILVLVKEGLTRLVRKSIDIGDYCGFPIIGICFMDILQFVDKTLLVGKCSWKYVSTMKSV